MTVSLEGPRCPSLPRSTINTKHTTRIQQRRGEQNGNGMIEIWLEWFVTKKFQRKWSSWYTDVVLRLRKMANASIRRNAYGNIIIWGWCDGREPTGTPETLGELGGSNRATDNDGYEKENVGMVRARQRWDETECIRLVVEMKMEGKRPTGRPTLLYWNTLSEVTWTPRTPMRNWPLA